MIDERHVPPLGRTLRHWRRVRKVSQLDLALTANISARHLSFIETGRSQPSREILLQLANALNLSLRHQNIMLQAAGYAPQYATSNLDGPTMQPVRYALERILKQHEPFPAVVTNRCYDILLVNNGFQQLLQQFISPQQAAKFSNLYRLVFSEEGMQPFFVDWPQIGGFLLARLQEEALFTQDESMHELLLSLQALDNLPPDSPPPLLTEDDGLPVLSFALQHGDDERLSFFSMFTSFGTPQDVTVQELRIETLFPADEITKTNLQNLHEPVS